MICYALFVTLFISVNFVPLQVLGESDVPLVQSPGEKNGSTEFSQPEKPSSAGLLGRLLNLVQAEKERLFVPISENCTLPSFSGSMIKNIEYQYFSYRIKTDGVSRFDTLRQSLSSITSYTEFRRILFPAPTEFKHPFFSCAFDMFFNHLMNRTPYIWLQWIEFDGSRFPFVWWQKVNV